MMRMLGWLGTEQRRRLSAGLLLSSAQALLSGVPLLAAFLLIRGALDGRMPALGPIAGGMAAAALLQVACLYWSAKLCYAAGCTMTDQLRLRIAEHMRMLPTSAVSGRRTGEFAETLNLDLQLIEPVASHILPKITGNLTIAAAILAAFLMLDPRLAALALSGFLFALPLMAWSQRKLRIFAGRRVEAQAEAAGRLLEFARGVAVLKANRSRGARLALLERALARSRDANVGLIAAVLPSGIGYVGCLEIGFAAMAAGGALAVTGGGMDLGALMIGLLCTPKFFPPLQQLMDLSGHLRLAQAASSRVASVLDMKPLAEPASPMRPRDTSVTFRNVSFAHGTTPILRDVSFHLPQGSTTAITGPSGAGKSTLTHLLLRHVEIGGGAIEIGGIDIRDMSSESLAGLTTPVFQDVFLLDDTIAANLRLARPDASDQEISRAARAACCDAFIARLPDGYETWVGEGGARLSGGERQRLSVARAILKDAPIVIVDEPTASLDPHNEWETQRALNALSREGRTLLVIAHRLSSIVAADQILVLDESRVVAAGRHHELLASCARYRRLWDAQRDVVDGSEQHGMRGSPNAAARQLAAQVDAGSA